MPMPHGDLAPSRVAALIPAAGSGQRLGGPVPKPYQLLGGREIVARTLDVVESCEAIDDIWLVVSADQVDYCQRQVVERYGFQKVRGLVPGGAERQDSVWCGLQRVSPAVELVVVHDGVRPFVTASLLHDTLYQARQHGAAIAAIPLKDTLKRVSSAGRVEATLPRERLWRTQTPQAFRRTLLLEAFAYARQQGLRMTDEAGLIEALGYPVQVVTGVEQNVKITTPDDLSLGERFLHADR
jgi:2-C-methyl-D-erythritol 4-phosphate cytidylyltransferase